MWRQVLLFAEETSATNGKTEGTISNIDKTCRFLSVIVKASFVLFSGSYILEVHLLNFEGKDSGYCY